MDRGEPTLAPEWLKATNSSSHSDENSSGAFSRNRINRLAVSVSEHDAPRASSSSTSFRRIASTNGSMGQEKDSYAHSRAYSSFGRSRDRDRDRDRDRHRDRQKDSLLGNGYCDYADSLMTRRSETKRTEIDSLRRSKSVVSGRKFESMPRISGSDSISALSAGSLSGSLSKVSFDRDFPSLGAEEKHELVRVPSPGISSAINSLHISSPTIIGADRWTSALAEAPPVGISNGLQTAASMASTGSSTTGGLSMAETLAQAPSKARSAPLLPNENERRKELTLMQYNKLIPVINSSEKSKTKGVRNGDLVSPKIAQSLPQLVNHASLRLPATKPDSLKISQAGNFLVLNREKNGSSPTAKDGSPQTIANRVPSASAPQLKTTVNSKLKANCAGEKKPPFQAQDRNNFFNSLRRQAEMKNGILNDHHHHPEQNCGVSSSSSSLSSMSNSVMKLGEKIMGVSEASTSCEVPASASGLESSVADNGNGSSYDEDPEALVPPDEEEKAFLESLGWKENAGEDALTAEEIESFVKKHEEKLGPDFKYKAGLPESRRRGSSSSGSSSSSSEAEMQEEKLGPDCKCKVGLPESRWGGGDSSGSSSSSSEAEMQEEKLGPDSKYKSGLPESRRGGNDSSGSSSSSSEAEM